MSNDVLDKPCPQCGKKMMISSSGKTGKLMAWFCYECKVVDQPIGREKKFIVRKDK